MCRAMIASRTLREDLAEVADQLRAAAAGGSGIFAHGTNSRFGSPGLLIVGLRRGRRTPVHYEANIGLVDAHTESGGGNDDVDPIGQKVGQRFGTMRLGKPRMIGNCSMTRLRQGKRDPLTGFSR